MPSSNRVIKANRASSGANKATISTEYERPKKVVEQNDTVVPKVDTQASRKEAEQLLKEATLESEQLIEESKAEIAQMREEAVEAGHQEGYEAGFQKGYEAGIEQAAQENKEIRQRAVEMVHEAHESIHQYEQDKKEELLQLAVHMAEKIIHNHIDQQDEGILAIAEPFFYQLDKEEEFVTVSVHPDNREAVESNIDEIKAISPGTRFMILGNPSLEKRGIVIESSHAVIDLQIKNQLDRMLEEFHEMERTVND